MKKYEFTFDTSIVEELREAMNDKLNVSLKKENYHAGEKVKYPSWGRMCAAMDRIEDTLKYINNTPIGCRGLRIAFDFYEFLNNGYVVIESIKTMANIFEVDKAKIKAIEESKDAFNEDISDAEFFSYLRSLCAVHPLETTKTHHKAIMTTSSIDCCPRAYWTEEVFGADDSDITVQIYGAHDEDYHSWKKLCISSFESYLKSWIEFIPEIIAAIHSHNEAQYDEWRSEKVKSLDDFGGNEIAYLCNLKKETIRRFGDGQDYMFDWYIDVLRFCPCDPRNVPLLEKYKNAIRRSLTFLQNELQTMSTSGFENTGVVNDPRCETDLFSELYSPYISGAHAFLGCNYNLGKLHYLEGHSDFGDRWLARSLLDEIKEVINRYVYFTNEEPDDETVILVRLAIYLDALECKCILNKSIPNDLQFRVKLLSESEYEELLRPDEESMEEPNLDLLDALVKLVDGE